MQATNRIPNILCAFVAVIVIASQMSVAAGIFAVQAGERQLFLDDVGISKVDNLKRTMHAPAKKGAVIRPTSPERSLQTRSAPQWDPSVKRFKLWMLTSYAESRDGLHWTKPILRQKEINGSLENNVVTVDPKREWPANAILNVVLDPDDPDPSRRFKGLGHCFGREPIVSPDGIHWKLLKVPMIPSQDESNMSYDRKTRTFIATVKHGGPYGRSVCLTTSKDFEHWTDPTLIFHADDLDQELGRAHIKARRADLKLQMHRPFWDIRDSYKGHTAEHKVDVYNMGLFRYEGLYIGTPAMFHSNDNRWSKDGFHLIQLVSTRDLKTFKRLGDRKTFIGPSKMDSGAYDLTQLLGPSNAVVRGDELWFYYTGIKYRARPKNVKNGGAICLAVLRRDGFISLDAGETEGTIQTKPFEVTGGKLFVNIDAIKGELRVEALDENGKVLAASAPMKGDLPRGEVKWQSGDLAGLKDKSVSLRFGLRNASLYSYWAE